MRLRRVGARHQPSYRIVVADQRAARDGAFVDHIGHYNPRTDPPTVVIDREKAQKWISQGASPSEAVKRMLKNLESADAEAVEAEVPEAGAPEADDGE
jgi:small subunit ribosomal protein S16